MPINVTNQEVRPTITQARVTAFTTDSTIPLAIVTVSFGHLDAQSNFITDRLQYFQFTSTSTPSFNQFVNNVPEVLNLRDALENKLIALATVPGVKV